MSSRRTVQVMSHKPLCEHRNILKLIGLSFQSSKVHQFLVPVPIVESANPNFPDLRQYMQYPRRIRPLPLRLICRFISDLADGISVLHDHGVVHGDIKPENVLIFSTDQGEETLKLGDFGSVGVDISNDPPDR